MGDETVLGFGAQGGTINNELADDFIVTSGNCDDLKGGVNYSYQVGTTATTITLYPKPPVED